MTGKIEFFAEVPSQKWVVVKKMRVDDDTTPLEIARFLASVHSTLHNKMFYFLGKELALEELDRIAAEIVGAEWNQKKKMWQLKGRISESKINEVLAKLKSPSVSREIGKVVKGKRRQELAKLYVTRKVLDLMKFPLEPDPSVIEKAIEETRLLE